jgi:hypothetical protein
MAHYGVSCDSCGAQNFSGNRHKCQHCDNYDLCDACFNAGAVSLGHAVSHPMTVIAEPTLTMSDDAEPTDFFPPEYMAMLDSGRSFTCPCCPLEFPEFRLYDHLVEDHPDANEPAVCVAGSILH